MESLINISVYYSIGLGDKKRAWRSFQIPDGLMTAIDEIVAIPELGYTSRNELAKEAIRMRIVQLEEHLERKEKRKASS